MMKIRHSLIILLMVAFTILSCSKSTTSDEEAIAKPVINPPGGSYSETIGVTIHSPTYGTTIRYTTDGSTPTPNSEEYSEIIQIASNTTLKAKAFKEGYISSTTASESYQFSTSAVEPVIINPPGGAFPDAQEVSMSCATPESQIRFTMDGSDPQISSTLYSQPILISSTVRIKARAYAEGYMGGPITTADFSFTLPPPVFSLEDGNYHMPQTVSISHPYPEAIIRYTTDGSDPDETSTVYSTAINVISNTLIKARAYLDEWQPSEVVTAFYIINLADQMQLVPGGSFHNGTAMVNLSPFYIGRREVTELEWVYIMLDMEEIVPDRPKNELSWVQAIEYCNYRSMAEGFVPCYTYGESGTVPDFWPDYWFTDHSQLSCNWEANGYRLPTEMEWMYAAQGGHLSGDYIYSGSNDLDAVGWYSGNASETSLAGLKQANELGIFDMSGNLWEFCWDNYHHEYPAEESQDPSGPESGFFRAMRGGSYSTDASNCTVSRRFYTSPTLSADSHGFRVVRKY
jgi:formylglycine-generating enzyme required for sulfatase activity